MTPINKKCLRKTLLLPGSDEFKKLDAVSTPYVCFPVYFLLDVMSDFLLFAVAPQKCLGHVLQLQILNLDCELPFFFFLKIFALSTMYAGCIMMLAPSMFLSFYFQVISSHYGVSGPLLRQRRQRLSRRRPGILFPFLSFFLHIDSFFLFAGHLVVP